MVERLSRLSQTPSEFVKIHYSDVWTKIINGEIAGTYNESREYEYETASYGTLYRDTLSKLIADKFIADLDRDKHGSILKINVEKFKLFDGIYAAKASEESENEFIIEVNLKPEIYCDLDLITEESSSSFMGDTGVTNVTNNECFESNNDDQTNNIPPADPDTMTREEISQAIDKAVIESNDSDRYICPICNRDKLKQQKDLHKLNCPG
jgi:hypothetical protein